MNGGIASKLGNWFEEDYVVLCLLRLLTGELEEVVWEPGDDGVDLHWLQGGKRVEVQCKLRREFSGWSWGRLFDGGGSAGRPGIMQHARRLLEEGGAAEYRLVSNRPAPGLEALVRAAREETDAALWWNALGGETGKKGVCEQWRKFAARARIEAGDAAAARRAHGWLRRMRVELVDEFTLDDDLQREAKLLASRGATGLVELLRRRAREQLGKKIRRDQVQAWLREADVRLLPRADDRSVHDRLRELAVEFEQRVEAVRGLPWIERPELDRLRRAVEALEPGELVLLHGPAGYGKSELLGALARHLRAKQWPALVLTPDLFAGPDWGERVGLDPDPVVSFCRYAAGRDHYLLFDQLDALLWSGETAQQRITWCAELLRRARDGGTRLVVACRTVDAERETQLQRLLVPVDAPPARSVRVGRLEDAHYGPVLAEYGVALDDLPMEVRRLAEQPLLLRLLVHLANAGWKLTDLRTLPQVVERWRELVGEELRCRRMPSALDCFDRVIERMERRGALAVPATGLCSDPGLLTGLEKVGLVRLERGPGGAGERTVRATHQLLVDAWIAQRWRELENADALLQRISDRARQTPHLAGRLRLALPFLRGCPWFLEFARRAIASPELRLLIKDGIWKGFAAIEDPRPGEVALVGDWLENPRTERLARLLVVGGQVAWVAALDASGWLERTWRSASPSGRRQLLELLASVSVRWGERVAEYLARWSKEERGRGKPKLLEEAAAVFMHDPSADSERLFELRMEYLRNVPEGTGRPIDWSELLRKCPRRAARLLAHGLQHWSDLELLLADPDFGAGAATADWCRFFPAPGSPPLRQAAHLGWDCWELLGEWWLGLEDQRLLRDGLQHDLPGSTLLHRVGDLLARCLAHGLQQRRWAELLALLPEPPRQLDRWLLLRVGAALEPPLQPELADAAIDWLVEQPENEFPLLGGALATDSLEEFVERVGEGAGDAAYMRLEGWICSFRDPWSRKQEERRWRRSAAALPNRRGALAYRLLPHLPRSRIGTAARRLQQELERKFERHRSVLFPTMKTIGGVLRSPVPDAAADSWSPDEWLRRLREAPPDARATQVDDNTVVAYERSTLETQLRSLAARNPCRYLSHAKHFAAAPAEPELRALLLDAVGTQKPPSDAPVPEQWQPLPADSLVELLTLPGYLEEPACSRVLARIVWEQPHLDWPRSIVRRLRAIACAPAPASTPAPTGAESADAAGPVSAAHFFSQSGCLALLALGALARRSAAPCKTLLAAAEKLVAAPADVGRAAAAVAALRHCTAHAGQRVARITLDAAARPAVAACPSVTEALLELARPAASGAVIPEAAQEARQRLLALVDHPTQEIARAGGAALVHLRDMNAVSDAALQDAARAGGAATRQGLAGGAADLLARPSAPPDWLLDLVRLLADDPDEAVLRRIAALFGSRRASRLLANLPLHFLHELLTTSALRRYPTVFLLACDAAATLLPAADLVLQLVENLATPPVGHTTGPWIDHFDLRTICGLVARLAEEAARRGDPALQARALDAWDRLLELATREAGEALAGRWIELSGAHKTPFL